MLEEEFGVVVHSPDLEVERNGHDLDNIQDWEKEMVRQTRWILKEKSGDGTPE